MNPLPDQSFEKHWLSRESGCRLYVRKWQPFSGNTPGANPTLTGENVREKFPEYEATEVADQPRRTLLIVHGACEHGERYVSLAERASRAGWRVLLPDQRGHGRSSGEFVHVDRFEQYLEDLQTILDHWECQPESTAMIGCSLGGLISIRLNQWRQQQTGQSACRLLWLISPLLGIKHPIAAWKKLLAGLLGQHLPRTRFRSTIHPADLTHDQAVLSQRLQDRLIRRQVTARWFLEVSQALQLVFAQADEIRMPCVIWQAGDDRVVDPLAARAWQEWVNQTQNRERVRYHALPGWFHEILKETEGPELIELLVAQLTQTFDEVSPCSVQHAGGQ